MEDGFSIEMKEAWTQSINYFKDIMTDNSGLHKPSNDQRILVQASWRYLVTEILGGLNTGMVLLK